MKIWIKKETIVATVTDFYLDVIAQGLTLAGHEAPSAYEWEEMDIQPGDRVLVIGATRARELWKKKIPYLYWAQGVWPEESYMRYHSVIRYLVQSYLERKSLKKAEFVFFVSDAMKKHYEKKYRLKFEGKFYIMPCVNEEFHRESFHAPGKYENRVFCYAGGLSEWQCFEETVALYRKIEEKYPDSKLLLLVKERDKALEVLQKYGVNNYEINYVPREELEQVLKGAAFGFVLRKDSAVNKVATPTKALTYLANGLIPVYSRCLEGLRGILGDTRHAVCCADEGDISGIVPMMDNSVNSEEVQKEFEAIYHKHYDPKRHIQQIAALFKARLEP